MYVHIYCLVYFSFVKIRLVTVHNVFMFEEWSIFNRSTSLSFC